MLVQASRKPATLLLAVPIALSCAFVVLGAPVVLLTQPAYTRLAESRLVPARETGVDRPTQLRLAEAVRRFIVDPDSPPLPRFVNGMPAFDVAAVSHLLDVRRVIVGGRRFTLLALVVLSACFAIALGTGLRRAIGLGLLAGAIVLALAVVLSALYALVDFDAFFAAFHSLFFRAGTWQFADEALLIRLFPERFWVTAGAAWAMLSLVLASASAVLGIVVLRRSP